MLKTDHYTTTQFSIMIHDYWDNIVIHYYWYMLAPNM